ncbi:MAG: PrsW family glutamic-type intramembrane protease [Candidatus Micrarchaeota archaeon]
MKLESLLLAIMFLACTANAAGEDSIDSELFGVFSYLGIILLSFLFILVIVIPFVNEVVDRRKVLPARGPLTNPIILLIEFFAGVSIILIAFPNTGFVGLNQTEALVYIISGICALLPFTIFLVIAFISDIYKRNLMANIFPMAMWGTVASSAALVLNQFFELLVVSLQVNPIFILLALAAFFEEALKGIGLLEFFKHRIPHTVLAMLYGFSIGIGFSVIENWLYFSYVSTPDSLGVRNWTHILFHRSFFTTLAHAFFTASNALIVCKLKSKSRFIIGLLCAFVLHMAYNLLFVLELSDLSPFFVLAMAVTFLYVVYLEMASYQGNRRISGLVARVRRK